MTGSFLLPFPKVSRMISGEKIGSSPLRKILTIRKNVMIRRILICCLVAILISSCATPAGVRLDNAPMYGQPEVVRPAALKQADDEFIREVTTTIPDRKEASKIWWEQAEKFMASLGLLAI